MSMPAETPDDVIILPSSTQRAWRIHCTRGPCCNTQFQASLLDVAGLSSSRPVRASRAEPVQTVAVTLARWLAVANWLKNGVLLTATRVPKPPGINRMSNAGALAKLYSAYEAGPSPALTTPLCSAILKISNRRWKVPSSWGMRQEAKACTGPYTSRTVKPSNRATATRRTGGVSAIGTSPYDAVLVLAQEEHFNGCWLL